MKEVKPVNSVYDLTTYYYFTTLKKIKVEGNKLNSIALSSYQTQKIT